MKNVVVTGAFGQLGRCFQKLSANYPKLDFHFFDAVQLDITDKIGLKEVFTAKKIDYCINCAAYTNVEKAEEEKEKAFLINAEAVKNLAEICDKNETTLIHFSTDYVFDGQLTRPYLETDFTNPINGYGASKLKGEEYVKKLTRKHFIFRSSWLYSQFGHNFMKTILKKISEKAELNITTSQRGTPTNANDLAEVILQIITSENTNFGLYHYSNLGEATWYDFAKAIIEFSGAFDEIKLNKSGFYPTKAQRPAYSVLDKTKFIKTFGMEIPEWQKSLKATLKREFP